jgi:hypothetical protein
MTDDQLLQAFDACSLAPSEFHHAEHVRVAFLYLKKYPILVALERFSVSLKKFAAAAGKPNLYHETITWAFMLLIQERMARSIAPANGSVWEEFAAANADVMDWKANVLRKYYSAETLASPLAKTIFVMPEVSGSKSGISD